MIETFVIRSSYGIENDEATFQLMMSIIFNDQMKNVLKVYMSGMRVKLDKEETYSC